MMQILLPKKLITQLAGYLAQAQLGFITTWAIRAFIRRYGVDMKEAAQIDVRAYKSFNDFFTRPLAIGARSQSVADFLCPVDGSISQFGEINGKLMVQAKRQTYTTTALLGGDEKLAKVFENGRFANLYLGPGDYHRIHMPCTGRLERMIYVPGSLYSVNPATARAIPSLFAKNERIICVFESPDHGPFVMVLVGATIVGSMAVVWQGVINPPHSEKPRNWSYLERFIVLQKGEEMGHFLLGSTVIMLFSKDVLSFNSAWQPGLAVRMGDPMGWGNK